MGATLPCELKRCSIILCNGIAFQLQVHLKGGQLQWINRSGHYQPFSPRSLRIPAVLHGANMLHLNFHMHAKPYHEGTSILYNATTHAWILRLPLLESALHQKNQYAQHAREFGYEHNETQIPHIWRVLKRYHPGWGPQMARENHPLIWSLRVQSANCACSFSRTNQWISPFLYVRAHKIQDRRHPPS